MDNQHHFQNLRQLTKKKIQAQHRIKNLSSYQQNKIIPKGLRIKLEPQTPGVKSRRFMKRWNDILYNCSCLLLQLLFTHAVHYEKELVNTLNKALEKTDASEIEVIEKRLNDIQNIENKKTYRKTTQEI